MEIVRQQHLFILEYNKGEVGHAWVLDGYKTVTVTIREMARTATSGWFFTGQVSVEDYHYMHFNWGWYGDSNGYFAEGVYDTTQAQYYDAVTTDSIHNFTTGIKLLNVYHKKDLCLKYNNSIHINAIFLHAKSFY